jgi:hypothetical protein
MFGRGKIRGVFVLVVLGISIMFAVNAAAAVLLQKDIDAISEMQKELEYEKYRTDAILDDLRTIADTYEDQDGFNNIVLSYKIALVKAVAQKRLHEKRAQEVGTWRNAVKNGIELEREVAPPVTFVKYDTNNDNIADIEVAFIGNEPRYYRYLVDGMDFC